MYVLISSADLPAFFEKLVTIATGDDTIVVVPTLR